MNPAIMLMVFVVGILGIFSLGFIQKFSKIKNLKILSVLTFLAYCGSLFYIYAIDKHTINETTLFTPSMTIFIVFLRTFTTVSVVCCVMAPFYKNKYLKMLCYYFVPIITGLNIIYLNSNLIAMFGRDFNYFTNHRTYGYLLTIATLFASSFHNLYDFIKNKLFKDKDLYRVKSFFNMFLILFFMSIALMQQGLLDTFFGEKKGVEAKDFSDEHFIYMGI